MDTRSSLGDLSGESDARRKNGRSRAVAIDLLEAALKTHRAPMHALPNGKGAGIWAV